MKAIIKPAYKEERQLLKNVLPIRTPWRLTISAAQICNFKCFFCTHSLDKKEVEKTGFAFKNMTFEEFKQFADQLREFEEPIKLVVFSGMGEPLLNKDLPKMIAYLRDNKLAERIEMYSNGSLLTKEWVHNLIDAGLTGFKLSLEGLDEEVYLRNCGYKLNMKQFLDNIQYLYDNRKNCEVYIKIIDACMGDGEEEKFYHMFGNMCDHIFIEHLSDCQPLTGDCDGRVDLARTMYNEPAKNSKVCSLLFYSLYVDADFNIYPCVTLGLPTHFAIGNTRDESIYNIWNGEKLKELRIAHLQGKRNDLDVCKDCGNIVCMYHKEDDLDDACADLLLKYR